MYNNSRMGIFSFDRSRFDPKNNAFDIVRLFLAFVVVYAHSWRLDEGIQSWKNPVMKIDDMYKGVLPHGQLAVYGFFIISGFLITGSWLRSKTITEYVTKRFVRIYPGFLVCLIVTAFEFVPILYFLTYSNFDNYFPKYFVESFRFVIDNMQISINKGVAMEDITNGTMKSLNGPLWSLIFEVKAYIMIILFGLVGIFKKKYLVVLAFLGFWLLYASTVIRPELKDSLSRLTGDYKIFNLFTYFLAGSVFWIFENKIIWDFKIAIGNILALVIAINNNMFYLVAPISFTYLILFISIRSPIRNLSSKFGDYSYGVYIYSWPVQLILNKFYIFEKFGFTVFFLLSALFSFVMGYLSWNIVERKFLQRKIVKV
jgi:peptidoglycan/LPS O-acetylase OafA/YrhL